MKTGFIVDMLTSPSYGNRMTSCKICLQIAEIKEANWNRNIEVKIQSDQEVLQHTGYLGKRSMALVVYAECY